MKTYELFLHGKQGDDFAQHAAIAATVNKALLSWSAALKQCQNICEQIARALEGKNVSVFADTHVISLTADDAEAEKALDALTAEGLLTVMPIEDDDEAA